MDQQIKDKTQNPQALKEEFAALPKNLVKGRVLRIAGELGMSNRAWPSCTPVCSLLVSWRISSAHRPKDIFWLAENCHCYCKCNIIKPSSNWEVVNILCPCQPLATPLQSLEVYICFISSLNLLIPCLYLLCQHAFHISGSFPPLHWCMHREQSFSLSVLILLNSSSPQDLRAAGSPLPSHPASPSQEHNWLQQAPFCFNCSTLMSYSDERHCLLQWVCSHTVMIL